MNCSERILMLRNIAVLAFAPVAVVAFVVLAPVESQASGTASDGPGDAAAWTTGNKMAVGTSADTISKVWFTVAKGSRVLRQNLRPERIDDAVHQGQESPRCRRFSESAEISVRLCSMTDVF